MKYFLIAGEASGDLHAGHLISALRELDPEAEFRFFGGDEMGKAAGVAPLRHYKTLAYMGIVQVALHLRTILGGMRECREAIRQWRPDCLILVDYPGFNLAIAETVHREHICPVYYYISPKIWAWKEGRIKRIRRDVDHIFSILPFEVDYFAHKHSYPVTYVGNPSVDEIAALPAIEPKADTPPTIALLPGSRTAEITTNLPCMLRAALPLTKQGYTLTIAGAPSQPESLYDGIIRRCSTEADCETAPQVVFGDTFNILRSACAALVTSGTATLETAIIGTPQVVCYHIRGGRIINWGRPYVLKVPFISLPNLICQREIIPELIAADMAPANIRRHLQAILPGGTAREQQLADYADMRERLGEPGAPIRCARAIISMVRPNMQESYEDVHMQQSVPTMDHHEHHTMSLPHPTSVLPTSCGNLDTALGLGGLPSGAITEILGGESSGKSTFALRAIASAQQQGKVCMLVDTDCTFSPSWAQRHGVKTDELLVVRPNSPEQAEAMVEEAVKGGMCDLLVIDTLDGMTATAQGHFSPARFIPHLSTLADGSDCTVLIINPLRDMGDTQTSIASSLMENYAALRLAFTSAAHTADGMHIRVTALQNNYYPDLTEADMTL